MQDVWRSVIWGWPFVAAAAWSAWLLAPGGGGGAVCACCLCALSAWWVGRESGAEAGRAQAREARQRLLSAELSDWDRRKRGLRAGG